MKLMIKLITKLKIRRPRRRSEPSQAGAPLARRAAARRRRGLRAGQWKGPWVSLSGWRVLDRMGFDVVVLVLILVVLLWLLLLLLLLLLLFCYCFVVVVVVVKAIHDRVVHDGDNDNDDDADGASWAAPKTAPFALRRVAGVIHGNYFMIMIIIIF